MENLGKIFKTSRDNAGLSLTEVSNDIEVSEMSLKQIEAGSIGAFKDLHELKTYIEKYAVYLGLEKEEVMNIFNEYIFEITSKIPIDLVMKNASKKDEDNINLSSPYTNEKIVENKLDLFLIVLVVTIFILIIFFITYKFIL